MFLAIHIMGKQEIILVCILHCAHRLSFHSMRIFIQQANQECSKISF